MARAEEESSAQRHVLPTSGDEIGWLVRLPSFFYMFLFLFKLISTFEMDRLTLEDVVLQTLIEQYRLVLWLSVVFFLVGLSSVGD